MNLDIAIASVIYDGGRAEGLGINAYRMRATILSIRRAEADRTKSFHFWRGGAQQTYCAQIRSSCLLEFADKFHTALRECACAYKLTYAFGHATQNREQAISLASQPCYPAVCGAGLRVVKSQRRLQQFWAVVFGKQLQLRFAVTALRAVIPRAKYFHLDVSVLVFHFSVSFLSYDFANRSRCRGRVARDGRDIRTPAPG